MNKFLAILAIVVVACAAGVSAWLDMSEYAGWHCGAGGNGHSSRGVPASEIELVWSNKNDATCKSVCKKSGVYPVYKKGNWGLFTEGLQCCCSVRHLFSDGHYYETSPHISDDMSIQLGISGRDPPTD